MAIKSSLILLLIIVWCQGPDPILMSVADTVSIRWNSNTESFLPMGRFRRDVKLPLKLSSTDMKMAEKFAEGVIGRMSSYESNLMHGGVTPLIGSPTYNAMLASWADDNALEVAKEALIDNKASLYLANRNCMRYGMSSSQCAKSIQKLRMSGCEEDDTECPSNSNYRSYDGSCNNLDHPNWGEAYSPYSRLLGPAYDDGFWEPRGTYKRLPNPFDITSTITKEAEAPSSELTMSVLAWSNLVSNDVAHTVSNRMIHTGESIMCCDEDGFKLAPRYIHPFCMSITHGHSRCVNYVRSMLSKADCQYGPAEQMNAATHFLDGSGIYGTTVDTAISLRKLDGGLLKVDVTEGGRANLPRLIDINCHHENACFLAGERRINMDLLSAVLHTLLVREHNRIATELSSINPHWNDERLYQEAKRIVTAQIQHITYNEWLPIIIGKKEVYKNPLLRLSSTGYSQRVYNKNTPPFITNSFANSAMRFVTSMMESRIRLYNEGRSEQSSLQVQETIEHPELLGQEGMLDNLLRGMATQKCSASDLNYSNLITKYMYSGGNDTGLDGFSLDIQRGRDHGLPGYVEYRKLFGLNYSGFDKLSDTIPSLVVKKLKKVYKKVTDIDLIVGGMAEMSRDGSLLGPVFTNIITKQMAVIRSSDRYFYDNKDQPLPFTPGQLKEIRKSSLARIMCDNSDNVQNMQRKTFEKPDSQKNPLVKCSEISVIPKLDLNLWLENADTLIYTL